MWSILWHQRKRQIGVLCVRRINSWQPFGITLSWIPIPEGFKSHYINSMIFTDSMANPPSLNTRYMEVHTKVTYCVYKEKTSVRMNLLRDSLTVTYTTKNKHETNTVNVHSGDRTLYGEERIAKLLPISFTQKNLQRDKQEHARHA